MAESKIECRKGCGACCIFISISSAIPNHPKGKPSGTVCKNMETSFKEGQVLFTCSLWDTPWFPKICKDFQATSDLCGASRNEAIVNIIEWEYLTSEGEVEYGNVSCRGRL